MLVDQDFHSVVHNRLRQGGEGNIGTTLLSCEVSTAADYRYFNDISGFIYSCCHLM